MHLTLNTLLTDRELPAAAQVAGEINEMGVDAVIVQDLGVARMLHQVAPQLALHASTQMTVHSLDGVKECARRASLPGSCTPRLALPMKAERTARSSSACTP